MRVRRKIFRNCGEVVEIPKLYSDEWLKPKNNKKKLKPTKKRILKTERKRTRFGTGRKFKYSYSMDETDEC